MKSIEQIEAEAKEAFEKDKSKSDLFYPFLAGWVSAVYSNLCKNIERLDITTQMDAHIEAHCEQLKEKGLDAMFIQNTRSSMQHMAVMAKFYIDERKKMIQ